MSRMEELQGCLWLYNQLSLKAVENLGAERVTMDHRWTCRCNWHAKKIISLHANFDLETQRWVLIPELLGWSFYLCFILLSVQISPMCLKASGADAVPVLPTASLPSTSSVPAKEVTTPISRKARSWTHTKMVFQPERAMGVRKYPDH